MEYSRENEKFCPMMAISSGMSGKCVKERCMFWKFSTCIIAKYFLRASGWFEASEPLAQNDIGTRV